MCPLKILGEAALTQLLSLPSDKSHSVFCCCFMTTTILNMSWAERYGVWALHVGSPYGRGYVPPSCIVGAIWITWLPSMLGWCPLSFVCTHTGESLAFIGAVIQYRAHQVLLSLSTLVSLTWSTGIYFLKISGEVLSGRTLTLHTHTHRNWVQTHSRLGLHTHCDLLLIGNA